MQIDLKLCVFFSQNPSISNAIKNCIKPQLDQVNDTYSLNILAYTMAKAGRQKELAYLLTKLDSLAIKEGIIFIYHVMIINSFGVLTSTYHPLLDQSVFYQLSM